MRAARGRWTWVSALLVLAWGLWTAAEADDAAEFLSTGARGWAFFAAGFLALSLRPANRIGWLLLLVGGQFVLSSLEEFSRVPALWTLAAGVAAAPTLLTYAILAFPSGRLQDWPARVLVGLSFLHVPLLQGFVAGRFYDASDWGCTDCQPGLNLLLVRSDPALVTTLNRDVGLRLHAVIAVLVLLLLARRFVRATPPMRRVLLPVYAISLVLFPAAVGNFVASFGGFEGWLRVQHYVVAPALLVAPAAFVAGLLRLRARRSRVGQLVVRLGETSDAVVLNDALRQTLADPSAQVGFWDPEQGRYLTAVGEPLPAQDGRSATYLDGPDGPLAKLLHDPALAEEPELLEAAAAAARLAVDNARLTDRIRTQLDEVERSRARIVEAADEARRKVERDLHDGAQQRLVGLLMHLRSGELLARQQADGLLVDVLAKAALDLERALHELRELARGLHPPLLAHAGLAASLEDLVEASPVPVLLDAVDERFPPAVEAASYFVVAEALANVAKHAAASTATVRVRRHNGVLRVEVGDDGIGGADAVRGSGLLGLRDRVEAAGGTLTVQESVPRGTLVVAELPCGS